MALAPVGQQANQGSDDHRCQSRPSVDHANTGSREANLDQIKVEERLYNPSGGEGKDVKGQDAPVDPQTPGERRL